MPKIEIVENPRRRRRSHRRLTAKQLAAGFGGKRSMSGRRTKRRYRNPALATLAGMNPHRRRRSRGGYSVRHVVRHRNPGMLGGITSLIDLKGAAYVAGGIIIAKAGPNLIRKVWPGAPSDGIPGHAVRLGAVLLAATGVRYLLKSASGAQQVAVGGIGYILYDLANQYLLPTIGLAGLTDDGDAVTMQELEDLRGYQPSSRPMSGYQPSEVGQPELSM